MSSSTETQDDRRRRSPLLVLLLIGAVLLGLLSGRLLYGGDEAQAERPKPSSAPEVGAVQPTGEAVASATPQPTPEPSAHTTPGAAPPVVVSGTVDSAISGGGTGQGQTVRGDQLAVTSTVLGRLGPGRPAVVELSLRNTGTRPLAVTTASAVVTHVSGRGVDGLPPCSRDWFSIDSFAGTTVVPAGATRRVELPLTFQNSPTVNQDDCKGARFTYSFTVKGRPA